MANCQGNPSMVNIDYKKLDLEDVNDFNTIVGLVEGNFSEPYSLYVYRYFLSGWPDLCITGKTDNKVVAAVIGKLEPHKKVRMRGYIGMLVVDTDYRGHGIAKKLVKLIVEEMVNQGADEILLETEVHNKAAIALYESFGFLKTNKLHHYYLNQTSAYQLILPITEKSTTRWEFLPPIE